MSAATRPPAPCVRIPSERLSGFDRNERPDSSESAPWTGDRHRARLPTRPPLQEQGVSARIWTNFLPGAVSVGGAGHGRAYLHQKNKGSEADFQQTLFAGGGPVRHGKARRVAHHMKNRQVEADRRQIPSALQFGRGGQGASARPMARHWQGAGCRLTGRPRWAAGRTRTAQGAPSRAVTARKTCQSEPRILVQLPEFEVCPRLP